MLWHLRTAAREAWDEPGILSLANVGLQASRAMAEVTIILALVSVVASRLMGCHRRHRREITPTAGLLALLITTTTILVTLTSAFTVYDCKGNLPFATIDLRAPEECPDPARDFLDPIEMRMQILQTDAALPVTAYQCRVTVSRTAVPCSREYGITYASSLIDVDKVWPVMPNDCREAVQEKGSIDIHGHRIRPKIGTQNVYTWTSEGKVKESDQTRKGWCEVTTFKRYGITYTYSYEQSVAKITIRKLTGMHDLTAGTIKFQNGLIAKYKDTVLMDAEQGVIVWKAPDPDCKDTVSLVAYQERAAIHRRRNTSPWMEGAVVMIADNNTRQYAGLAVRTPRAVCGIQCYNTHVAGILACPLRDFDDPLPTTMFKDAFDSRMAQTQTQGAYALFSTNLRMYNRFEEVQDAVCEVERKTIFNKLQALAGGNPYAIMDTYGPGYTAYFAGAVAYIVQCEAHDAVPIQFPNCTTNMPVKVNNKTLFADAINYQLSDYPTIVPCSYLMPSMFFRSGKWVCTNQGTGRCLPPEKLNTSTAFGKMGDFTLGAEEGLFSPDQVQAHRNFQRDQETRQAVEQRVVNAAGQNQVLEGAGGFSIGSPLTTDDLAAIRMDLGSFFFPHFGFLATIWEQFTTAILFMAVAKVVVTVLVRMCHIYTHRGCTWLILLAACDGVFVILRVPFDIIKTIWAAVIASPGDEPGAGSHLTPQQAIDQRCCGLGSLFGRIHASGQGQQSGHQLPTYHDDEMPGAALNRHGREDPDGSLKRGRSHSGSRRTLGEHRQTQAIPLDDFDPIQDHQPEIPNAPEEDLRVAQVSQRAVYTTLSAIGTAGRLMGQETSSRGRRANRHEIETDEGLVDPRVGIDEGGHIRRRTPPVE